MTFAFVVSLLISSFGGQIQVTFEAMDLDSCVKLRRTVEREMMQLRMRFMITPESGCEVRLEAKKEVTLLIGLWLLIAPGPNWSWVIIDLAESKALCEAKRTERLDGVALLCVKSERY